MNTNGSKQRVAWWQEARFGMFIHWGIYAVTGRGEWVMYQEHFANEEYARLAGQFNPQHYNPNEWVAMAQDAGMKYMVLTTRHHDGNFLLNVGPAPDGRFPPEAVANLRAIGQWMRVNGRAVHGAGRSPVIAPALGWSTRAGNNVYLLVQRWPGPTLPFAWCGSRVASARLMSTGQILNVEQRGDRVWLHGLPQDPPDAHMNVVELTFAGEPRMHDPAYT